MTMPALGESVTEGTVTRWLKNVGDQVEVDEPLLEVSTDKVDTEIPSPVAGTLQEILAEEDETVAVGADLAVIGDGAAPSGGDTAPAEESASASADDTADAAPAAEDNTGQTGDGDAVDSPSDQDAVTQAGDEGGQEPAEPHTDEAQDAPADSAPAPSSGDSGGGGGGGTTVTMPALGESVTEGTITRWLKAEGDEVAVDEPLLEVSTDKVDTEIPSPVAGTLSKILVQEDETVPVGADLAVVGGSGSADSGSDEGAQASQPAEPAEEKPAVAQKEPEAPAAQKEPEAPAKQEEPEATAKQESAPAKDEPADEPAKQQQVAPDEPAPSEGKVAQATAPAPTTGGSDDASAYVTPLVRKIASENKIDLGTVKGTGVGGRIRKQDVLAAAEAAKAPAPKAEAAPAAAPEKPAAARTGAGGDTDLRGTTQKMSRLRKMIATRMVESLQNSAQLTTVVEVDVTKIARLRDRAKADFAKREGTKLSFLPFFTVAAIEALKVHPTVNASIDGDTVIYHGSENIGMAVDTPKGLIVPVLKNAGDLNIAGLSRNIADLAERTRTNKITPDDLAGGTFTITNTGSRGALFDTPIINMPQVAILGTGAVVKRPVVVKDSDGGETIAIRSMVYLALSYDHRIVDGADAARFLGTVKERLEEGAFEADLGL
ncbi:dihydrolipoamide acetyltransferase [Knoellia aerolata DSM 18566]|uniref:Dihydrolipoamide acetyltransferase component of pyruvate dehydrogenase complex n=1 Tax=Knoellia aerolata DSM 18566 TaxID=1385519 RepID=A0A0A0JQ98_9MICO|nr:dihydrolipoamide acetyltransferase [Knoellia aerolata DSM 18566]